MRIRLLVVGKIRNNALDALITEYERRIQRFCEVKSIVVKAEESGPQEYLMEREGERLQEKFAPGNYLVALDSRGDSFTSNGLADFLFRQFETGKKEVDFVIGGSYGLSARVKARANRLLSLSKLTFNHEMVRLFLLEQLYRCFTIRNNFPYHK